MGHVACQLAFQTAIGKIPNGGSVRQYRQLRTQASREAAVDPDDRAKPDTWLARSGEREVILVAHRLNRIVGQHQSGIAARTRSGVIG